MSRFILLVMLVACGDNLEPKDDGFGEPCDPINDGRAFTACETETGAAGVCAIDTCRRWCAGDETSLGACPANQRAIPTVDNLCWCEPD